MKTQLKQIMLMLTLVFTFASCSSDDDNNSGTSSREVKYEITGNYTGEMDVTYLEKSGAPLNEDINTLPWTKEYTATEASSASIQAGGFGGVKGQTLTGKIYVGGKVVSELTATANDNGIIVLIPKPYAFPM